MKKSLKSDSYRDLERLLAVMVSCLQKIDAIIAYNIDNAMLVR